jgi:hypothetical protein
MESITPFNSSSEPSLSWATMRRVRGKVRERRIQSCKTLIQLDGSDIEGDPTTMHIVDQSEGFDQAISRQQKSNTTALRSFQFYPIRPAKVEGVQICNF